ncbi:MAG: glycosyltransferase, partial [Candidatus Micrarchaeota archaeon]
MKIAFFTETYLPNRDGVVSSILTTREALEREGHEVYVFCAGDRQAKKENKDARAFYHISTAFSPYPDYKLALFPFFSERKVRQLGIDIIHTHGMATMGLAAVRTARTLHLPIIGTLHTLIPEAVHYVAHRKTTMALSKRLAWGYLRWYFNLCDRVFAPSEVIKEIMEEHKIKNVTVLPSGINTKRFNPGVDGDEIRKKHGLGSSKVVLYLGRLVKEKNLELLVRAALIIMEEIPDCKFIIAGTGPAEDYYKSLVKSAGLEGSFIFAGLLSEDDVPKYYGACDIFVFPSKFET